METDLYWREGFETLGNNYFKGSFKKEIIENDMVYDKHMLCIGKNIRGKPYYLNLKEACRIIVIGATRSGKTFSMRSMVDRLNTTDVNIIHLNDCKNEFPSSLEPVQHKFRHLLLPNERPRRLKILPLRPTFFKSVSEELPDKNYWFSTDFKKMSQNDFMTLMNVDGLTPNQKIYLDLLHSGIAKHFEKHKDDKFSVELIYKLIEEIEDINSQQKSSMKLKFRPLETSHFYEEENELNIVKLMQNGFIPAINMENFDSFGKGNFLYPEVLLSIVLFQVINARRQKKLKDVWVFLDEAPRFIGSDKKTSIRELVEKSVELDTRYGVNYCLSENTEIKLSDGSCKKIFDLDERNDKLVSFDFNLNKQVESSFYKFYTGEKEVFEIELENGKKIEATEEHIFFVEESDGKIVEKKVKHLTQNDNILCSNKKKLFFNPNYNNKWSEEKKEEQKNKIKKWREKNPEWCKYNDENFKYQRLGKKNTTTQNKKISEANRNRLWSEKSKEKLSISQKNRLSKLTDRERKEISLRFKKLNKGRKFSKDHKEKISKSNFGKKLTKEHKIKISISRKSKNIKLTDEQKELVSQRSKDVWKRKTPKERQEWIAKSMKNNLYFPNKLEKYCIKLFKKNNIDLDYVGDGSLFINGGCPDFINKNKKIIIEVFSEYFKLSRYGSIYKYKKSKTNQYSDYNVLFYKQEVVYSDNFLERIKGDINKTK